MPYYLHVKTLTAEEVAQLLYDAPRSYDSRESAFEVLKRDFDPKTHMVTFLASATELQGWRRRERARFATDYVRVPWHDSQNYALQTLHYVHMSTEKPGLIAFTADIEHGVQDRQTRVRPGKYLSDFYADIFSATEIAAYVAQCAALADSNGLQLAVTRKEILAIYNVNAGPSSCMVRKPKYIDADCDCDPDDDCCCERRENDEVYQWQHRLDFGDLADHPCAAYADSDLAVAYVGNLAAGVSQRAVIWPAKKTYTRIYGSGPLSTLLNLAGYTQTSGPVGARIRYIETTDDNGELAALVPYIDGISNARIDGRSLVLGDGPICCDTTEGCWAVPQSRSCSHCETEFTPTERNDAYYCDTCDANQYRCDRCRNRRYDWPDSVSWYVVDYGRDCRLCPDCQTDIGVCFRCDERFTHNGDRRNLCTPCLQHADANPPIGGLPDIVSQFLDVDVDDLPSTEETEVEHATL